MTDQPATPHPFIRHLPAGGIWHLCSEQAPIPPRLSPRIEATELRVIKTECRLPRLHPDHDHHNHKDYQLPSPAERGYLRLKSHRVR